MGAAKEPLEPQPAARVKPRRLATWDKLPPAETPEFDRAVDWASRQGRGSGLLRWLERIALAMERPVNRLVGAPQLNPFYHTDTIALFFLAVVGLTGVYVLLLYQFGYEASYESVAKVEGYLIGRVIRALHRYASGGLVTATLLHAVRTFFMDRFRGPRTLAWVSGVGMTAVAWLAGVTGYWLIWDERAQAITQEFVNLLKPFPSLAAAFYDAFLSPSGAENGWILMFAIFVAHLGLSALIGLFFWYHVKKLERPKLLPPPHWMIGLGALALIVALAFPAGMLPIADFSRQPEAVPLDLFYLFYLPLALRLSSGGLWVVVVALLGLIGLLAAVPWIFPRQKKPPVVIDPDRCVGCTLCAEDCPYGALRMAPRDDDAPYKQIAVVDPARCVSCGICIGSCPTLAIGLADRPAESLWRDVSARLRLARAGERPVRLVFACERHSAHGARPYLRRSAEEAAPLVDGVTVEVVPVICAAMIHPDLLTRALEAGAAAVQVVGCPPDDCANREGNAWLEERLARRRAPRLKRAYATAPIHTAWLPPDEFERALSLPIGGADSAAVPPTPGRMLRPLSWRHFVPAFALLALVLLAQVLLTRVPFAPHADAQAWIRIVGRFEPPPQAARLVLAVDDRPAANLDLRSGKGGAVLEEIAVAPGEHRLRLYSTGAGGGADAVLWDDTITLRPRQVFALALDDLRPKQLP
jgi:NAD-dependent dihydropyrimidine dehydrogenase PreA subunit/coenzyme F420-reducing hydrogenase delta subunit